MATSSDTMIEGLKSLLGTISQMKVLPDADPNFLDNIENQIVTYVKAAGQQQINGALQTPGVAGMGQPQGPTDATMGMSMMAPQQIGPGGGGGMSGLAPQQPPNADELRRVLNG